MHELYVGREAWKNDAMAVSDAKKWLAEIPLDDPNLAAMLMRVAKGEYPKIQRNLTEFLIELVKSKHKDSEKTLTTFTEAIIESVYNRIDLARIPKAMRDILKRRTFN